jgi:hypothetical protein
MSSLAKAFSSPAMTQAFQVTQQFAMNRFLPPPVMPAPEPEPMQYLKPPGPYSTGPSWSDTFGTLGTMTQLTAFFVGIGALLGVSASLCAGKREKESDEEIPDESAESDHRDDFERWVDDNYDRPVSPDPIKS